ncbi:glycoside transferase family 32 [Mucilaginibacter limnophilus]|uniref:Glycoside transferase family 32 n=1 Tax=Mucilaginibacter limnophilus TaxID=1932778 RepID=A0A437MS29_9SPHI|nr:glycosyltransferase [Mucilaginibacter limnophilus]RVU00433.1 glycoside transferase family 32 [Mucilaginibacter limnophilus]
MMIPRIIHQTWKNTNVDAHLAVLAETWREKHPGWEYRLWTDDMNRAFIAENYPEFLITYDNYPYNIQRVDAVRYFILYKIGGVFIDLDFECLQNISSLLINKTCVMGLEPNEHCKRFDQEKIVCNAFMACTPGNLFFETICTTLKEQGWFADTDMAKWMQILATTGPFKLTRIFDGYPHKSHIELVPSNALYPLGINEIRALFNETLEVDEALQKKISDAYAIHYFLGSWLS